MSQTTGIFEKMRSALIDAKVGEVEDVLGGSKEGRGIINRGIQENEIQ